MNEKILVTGANGLVGNALKEVSKHLIPNIEFTSRDDCNLMDYRSVFDRIKGYKYIIHTAGRVGGIGRNLSTPADQFYENIIINTNVINAAYKRGIKKLIAFSSMCAFPEKVSPYHENNFHSGEPFPAHRSYAYAKRMVDIQIEAYRKQYKVDYCCLIPGNIFGCNDNYSLTESHVVPALIHKAYLASKTGQPLEVWGDGSAAREFIYAKDLALICLALINSENPLPQRLVVSSPKEEKIKDIAEIIAKHMNINKIKWLTDKPNGQLSRPSDTSLFRYMFPHFNFSDINNFN